MTQFGRHPILEVAGYTEQFSVTANEGKLDTLTIVLRVENWEDGPNWENWRNYTDAPDTYDPRWMKRNSGQPVSQVKMRLDVNVVDYSLSADKESDE